MLVVLVSSSADTFKPIAAGGVVPPEKLPIACKVGGLRKHKIPAAHWWSHSTRLWRCTLKEEDACWQCCSSALLIYLESSSLLVLVEWFHQKDYPLHAKVGASGSMKCQQLIGGTIPPGSRGAPSKRRMYVCWQCWSSALLIHFKPIAAGGMVPTTNWIQRWGPQEA